MRRSGLLFLLIAPVVLVVMAPSAWAYFTSQAAGQGTAMIGSLPAPTGVTGTPTGGTVGVHWTDPAAPGSGTLGYFVTRTPVASGPTVGVCGSAASPLASTQTGCTDETAPVGTYTYEVTSTYASWTSASTASAEVSVGVATTATELQMSPSTATDGSEQLVTITATVTPQIALVPTGSIDVTSGSTSLCTITLPETSCSPDPSALASSATPYAIAATYSGDGSFSGSTSGPSDLTVYSSLAITTTALAPAWAGETGYSQTLTATGGFGVDSWAIGSGILPTGLSLNSDTGLISGSLSADSTSRTLLIVVTDDNGASATQSLTLSVEVTFVRELSYAPTGTNSSFQVTLSSGVTAGDTLALTVSQACTTGTGTPVDSHVSSVTGDSLTWVRATATGCTSGGDVELWYGLGTTTGGSSTKITVTLAAAALVQFANVTEYAHVTGWDPTAGATSTGTGIGIQASSGTSVPSAAGELVLGGAFVTRPTPFTVGGLVNPFSDLNVVSPYQGFGAYAIDAATGPLALVYDQTVGGTPTAGPWSAAVTAFTLTP